MCCMASTTMSCHVPIDSATNLAKSSDSTLQCSASCKRENLGCCQHSKQLQFGWYSLAHVTVAAHIPAVGGLGLLVHQQPSLHYFTT